MAAVLLFTMVFFVSLDTGGAKPDPATRRVADGQIIMFSDLECGEYIECLQRRETCEVQRVGQSQLPV